VDPLPHPDTYLFPVARGLWGPSRLPFFLRISFSVSAGAEGDSYVRCILSPPRGRISFPGPLPAGTWLHPPGFFFNPSLRWRWPETCAADSSRELDHLLPNLLPVSRPEVTALFQPRTADVCFPELQSGYSVTIYKSADFSRYQPEGLLSSTLVL